MVPFCIRVQGNFSLKRLTMAKNLIQIAKQLSKEASSINISDPVMCVYNPLDYAWKPHRSYLEKYGGGTGRVLLIGMNPGPWGMAQTGVPFGEINAVRDFLQIEEPVGKPEVEHPKRPISGFSCSRSEVSGRRLWNWAQMRYGTAEDFFNEFFVWNYCPLCFMEESGKNRTPDKLDIEERNAMFLVCDASLVELNKCLQPSRVIGIGGFAQKQAKRALQEDNIGTILHPSPASPMANRGWVPQIEKQFEEMGISLPIAL